MSGGFAGELDAASGLCLLQPTTVSLSRADTG
jgi:hypothetical protein